jgi:AraC family L-rhamnose operon transcriptional activator RhaR
MLKSLSRWAYPVSPIWPVGSRLQLHNGSVPTHAHDFIEIAIVLSGAGMHRSILGDQTLEAGDVFVLHPSASHSYHDCCDLQFFNIYFGLEFFERELGFVVRDPGLNYLLWAGPLNKQRNGLLALKLAPAQRLPCRRSIDTCWALANGTNASERTRYLASLLLLLDCLRQSLDNVIEPWSYRKRHLHAAIDQGIRLLESQISYPWTLQELAIQLHFTPSYLVRLFKRHTGLAPLQYLARARAEAAAHLLLTSSKTIAEIGRQVGWSDPSYFSERFKAHYGLTANEYRRKFSNVRT